MQPMFGTTGSTFTPFAEFPAGRVGFRALGNDEYRVRVEPAEEVSLPLSDWTQPSGSQNRYSKIVSGPIALGATIGTAVNALVFASADTIQ